MTERAAYLCTFDRERNCPRGGRTSNTAGASFMGSSKPRDGSSDQ